jgi:hypothetical protein
MCCSYCASDFFLNFLKKLLIFLSRHWSISFWKTFLLGGFCNANPDARHNVYFSKQYAYDPAQAVVRACLTVIDHNRNAHRKPRKDRDGVDKVTSVSTRDGLDSKKRVIMEAKDTTWRQEILAEVLQVGKKQLFGSLTSILCFINNLPLSEWEGSTKCIV